MKAALIVLLVFVSEKCFANDGKADPVASAPITALSKPVKPHLLCPTDNILGSKGSKQDRFSLLSIDGVLSFKPDCNPPAADETFQVYASFVKPNSSDDTTNNEHCSGFVRSDDHGRYHVIVPITKSYEDRSLMIITCTEPVYTCSVVSIVVNGWKKTGPKPIISANELATMMTMKPDQLPIGYQLNFSWCVADDKNGTVRAMTRNQHGVAGPDGVLRSSPPVAPSLPSVNVSFETVDKSGVKYKYKVLSPDLMEVSVADGKSDAKDNTDNQPKSTPRKARGIFDSYPGRMRAEELERERENEEVRNILGKMPIEKSLKRNWNDAGMGWIKRNEDKRNWNEAGMGWIKRKAGKGVSRVDWKDRLIDTPDWLSHGKEDWMSSDFQDKGSEMGRTKRSLKNVERRRKGVVEIFNQIQKE